MVGGRAGPLEPTVLQALVGYPRQVGSQPGHLGPDLRRVAVGELTLHAQVQPSAEPPPQLAEDLPVRATLAYGLHRLADPLDAALAVGERTIFFREAGGGQHHVRYLGGLVQEDVLDDQELQALERLLRTVEIGLAEERVLAGDVHGLDPALEHLLDHIGDDQALSRGSG